MSGWVCAACGHPVMRRAADRAAEVAAETKRQRERERRVHRKGVQANARQVQMIQDYLQSRVAVEYTE